MFLSLSPSIGLTWETGETLRSSRSCPASTLDKAQKWEQCPDPLWTRQYVCEQESILLLITKQCNNKKSLKLSLLADLIFLHSLSLSFLHLPYVVRLALE